MKTRLPEIRIKDAWMLRQEASVPLNKLWGNGEPLRSDEEYKKVAENYKDAWEPFEKQILQSMCDILELNFRQEIIDVYIAPWFGAFSDPLVIGVIYGPDEFIDSLTHELLHRLLTDNTKIPYDLWLIDEWQNLFGKSHVWNTLVHIPVHAVHKAVYLDILNDPKRYERDKKTNEKNKAVDYVNAWEYVDTNGYKEIIEKLRKSYKRLSLNNKSV